MPHSRTVDDLVRLTGLSGALFTADSFGGSAEDFDSIKWVFVGDEDPNSTASYALGFRRGSIYLWGQRWFWCVDDSIWVELANRASLAAVVANLTDSTGGIAGTVLASIDTESIIDEATFKAVVSIKNSLASIAADLAAIKSSLRNA